MLGRNQTSTNWTPERDEYVRQNYRIISTKKIGEALGTSKCAVIGRAHRIGLGKPYAEVFNRDSKHETKPKKAVGYNKNVVRRATGFARMHEERAIRVKKTPPPELNISITYLNGVGVKMWDLGKDHCRWVVGEPKELTFCGCNKRPNSSYCEDHHNWTVNRK